MTHKRRDQLGNEDDIQHNPPFKKINASVEIPQTSTSEAIFSILNIRQIVLDHLRINDENFALFQHFGNETYFKQRLKVLLKADVIQIMQKSSEINTNYGLHNLLRL